MTDLCIQDKVKSKQVRLKKVLGTDNPADIFTKYVERSILQKAMSTMNMVQMTGRPACAPAAMGAEWPLTMLSPSVRHLDAKLIPQF